MKRFFFLSLFFVTACIRGQTTETPSRSIDPTWVDTLLDEAREQNPGLEASAVQAQAAALSVDSVRNWEDPTLTFGVSVPTSRGFKSSEEGDLLVGIEQKLPTAQRPEWQRTVARALAARENQLSQYEQKKRRRDLLVALHGLAFAQRDVVLAAQDVQWLSAMVDSLDHRYRVGQATQIEWLKAQTAHSIAVDDLKTKQLETEHGAFALNRILNRELHRDWPQISLPDLQPDLYYTSELVAAALKAEPMLKVIGEETAAADATAELTRRERLPEFSVGIQARQYSGDAGLREGTATVSFTVPWLNRRQHDEDWQREKLRARASRLSADDRALTIREELHHHLIELDGIRRRALLYRDQIVPLTQQTLDTAQAAWSEGRGLFQDVLDAHRMLIANEEILYRAIADQGSVLAEINLLTGTNTTTELLDLAAKETDDSAHHHAP